MKSPGLFFSSNLLLLPSFRLSFSKNLSSRELAGSGLRCSPPPSYVAAKQRSVWQDLRAAGQAAPRQTTQHDLRLPCFLRISEHPYLKVKCVAMEKSVCHYTFNSSSLKFTSLKYKLIATNIHLLYPPTFPSLPRCWLAQHSAETSRRQSGQLASRLFSKAHHVEVSLYNLNILFKIEPQIILLFRLISYLLPG